MTTTWRKSTHSGTQAGSDCVEVGRHPDTIALRDSKNPDGPRLHLNPDNFRTLITNLKR